MNVAPTKLPGVVILTPTRHRDDRGYFSETWSARAMRDAGLNYEFVQDNHSLSHQAGTLRGLHFQAPPDAQAKLVRCARGAIFDVAVDIRSGSPSYGAWVGAELSAENGQQLLIPAGFLHGFVTRAPDTEVIYKCSAHYAPQSDAAVRWDDPDIGIDWGLSGAPILSGKDASAPRLAEIGRVFSYSGAP